jgi:hypothetical protein
MSAARMTDGVRGWPTECRPVAKDATARGSLHDHAGAWRALKRRPALRGPEAGCALAGRGEIVVGQPHFELVASTNVLTEVTKADVWTAIVAMLLADGLEGNALTVLVRVSREDLIAFVSFGKSL